MLPIRLGMLNARGPQDLVLWVLTRNGRVETTNYRTVKLPANVNIPPYVKFDREHGFGAFYPVRAARAASRSAAARRALPLGGRRATGCYNAAKGFLERGALTLFSFPVRVYYEDTDRGGVVYYANYLRFFERARTEWLRSLGVNQERLAAEDGVGFVVSRAEIDFRIGARLDDLLAVTVRPLERRRTYFWLEQEARLADGRVAAKARIQAACIRHRDMRPQPIPETLAARIAK
jgi:acyl-CoA thioester hydrolase